MNTVFSAQNVHVSFGGTEVVHGASISALPGRTTVLLGPNGAGKSTTLRAALGLIKASGDITVSGRTGTLLDDGGLLPGLTGREHLHATALMHGVPTARVQRELERVAMDTRADAKIKTYSLGMKRRIALAAALLPEPEILVLDEPTSGLDPEGIRWFGRMIQNFAAAGTAVILATHHLAEAADIADDVTIIAGGSTKFSGPLDHAHDLEQSYFESLGEQL